MASLFNKIAQFAGSPQGRRAIRQAKQFANDPRRRRQAKEMVEKVRQQVSGKRRRGY